MQDRLRQLLHERRLLKHMEAKELRAAVQAEHAAATAAAGGKTRWGVWAIVGHCGPLCGPFSDHVYF